MIIEERKKFPNRVTSSTFAYCLKDFETAENKKEIPAIIKYTAFSIDISYSSNECFDLLNSIRDCTNKSIYESFFIREYIDYNWNGVFPWVLAFSILQILIIFAFIANLTFIDEDFNGFYIFIVFLFVILYIWEFHQLYSIGPGNYIAENWNKLDIAMLITIVYWIFSPLFFKRTIYESFLLALLLMIRGLTIFKMLSGTRYYVELILASLNSIKYFLILFFYSTLFFSVLISISQNKYFDFDSMWNQSWDLNFGGDITRNTGDSSLTYLAVMATRIVNVVLMLNMLISILGDKYDNFLLEKHIIDYREKLNLVIEIQTMLKKYRKATSTKKYFHFLQPPFRINQIDEEWQGNTLYTERKHEKRILGVRNKIKKVEKRICDVENRISSDVARLEKVIVGVIGRKNNNIQQK